MCKGHGLSSTDYRNIIQGLEDNDLLGYDVILSGYTKSSEILLDIGETVKKAKVKKPDVIYVLDPVLGDNGRFYVPEELLTTYLDHLVPLATVFTPNQFEAEVLSGISFHGIKDVLQASTLFHDKGVKLYVQKGLKFVDEDHLQIVASLRTARGHFAYQKIFPKINRNFSGCGDLFSALVTAWVYRFRHELFALERHDILGSILDTTVTVMSAVLEKTVARGQQELAIIESSTIFLTALDDPITPVGLPAHVIKGPVVGVIFDMDGTLTEPGAIDFKAMYDRNGLKRGDGDIISQIQKINDASKVAKALAIIEDEEARGCDRMQLRSDAATVVSRLQEKKIHLAISTRNGVRSVETFSTRFPEVSITQVLHRDSLGGVNKPDPAVVRHILRSWGFLSANLDQVESHSETFGDVWFVGDSLDDMRCGKEAGVKTCLVLTEDNLHISTDEPGLVDLTVTSLSDFLAHLQ